MKFELTPAPLFAELDPSAACDVERILCYYAAQTATLDDGPAVHAIMRRHALCESFDDNTGGGVWLSYTVDTIGANAEPVLIIAGWDSCMVYRLPAGLGDDLLSVDPAEAAGLVWDLCGDDDSIRLGAVYIEDDSSRAAAFVTYCEQRKATARDPAAREYWHRLLGNARKAATL